MYRVGLSCEETRVEVWENDKCWGNTPHSSVSTVLSNSPKLPQVFLLNNFIHELEISMAWYLRRTQPESTNTHRSREQIIWLFEYKSTCRSKLYLNPLHRHLENAKKRPVAHTAMLLTMYHRLYNPSYSRFLIVSPLWSIYRLFSRDAMTFQNLKLKLNQSFYPHQA